MTTATMPATHPMSYKGVSIGYFPGLAPTKINDKNNKLFYLWEQGTCVYKKPALKIQCIDENLTSKILQVFYPKKWKLENITEPSNRCREKTVEIAIYLLNDFGLHPDRVRANKEEGITLYYKNHENEKELIIEVYNTLDMAALVNENKTILSCIDFEKKDEEAFKKTIRLFRQ